MSGTGAVKQKIVLFVDDGIPNCRQFLRAFFPAKESVVSQDSAEVIQKMTPDGMLIFIVRTTEVAVALFKEKFSTPEAIDLIFMDRSGPGMDGDWAIRAIRSFESEIAKVQAVTPCHINHNTTDSQDVIPPDVQASVSSGPNVDPATGKNVKAGWLEGVYPKIIRDFFNFSFVRRIPSSSALSLAGLSLASLSLDSPLNAGSGMSSVSAASGPPTPFRAAAVAASTASASATRVDSPCRISALRTGSSPFGAVLMTGDASPSSRPVSRSGSRTASGAGSRSSSPAMTSDIV